MKRQERFNQLQQTRHFDVVILGGGINGACLYDTLCRQGYKVFLADKQDFSAGTSQSSGMMIWGGLLYLRNRDIISVFQLSRDRDDLIRDKPEWIAPKMMRYLPSQAFGRSKEWMYFGLWIYWLMGMGRRHIPRWEPTFDESELLKSGLVKGSLTYEEAFLNESDARFVYHWIAPHQTRGQIALNYCHVQGSYHHRDKRWHLNVRDSFSEQDFTIQSALIVNCAGVWTDHVNAEFGIVSPFRHCLSRGVYLGFPRHEKHHSSLFFDLGAHGDVITHVPWGPIALWGPTATPIETIEEGLTPSNEDIDFLLEHYAHRYRKPMDRSDIVSLRCGIYPLVVNRDDATEDYYNLDISRREKIFHDNDRPWIACYGGKLTGCTRMASRVLQIVKHSIPEGRYSPSQQPIERLTPEKISFPGLSDPVICPAWSAQHEFCCTLEDYLRRRTNIAQWVYQGGLGKDKENISFLKTIALHITHRDSILAEKLCSDYCKHTTKIMNAAGIAH